MARGSTAYRVDDIDRTEQPTSEELAREVELREQQQLDQAVVNIQRSLRYGPGRGARIRSREEDK
jgi:hypothetical protein